MVIAILFPLAAVTSGRSHISVTIFTNWMGQTSKNVLSLFGHIIGLIFSAFLLFAAYRLFVDAWLSGEYHDGDIYIPMWIGYGTFLLALMMFTLRVVLMIAIDYKSLQRDR